MSDDRQPGFRFLPEDDPASGILAYAIDGPRLTEEEVAPVWARFDAAREAGTKIRILSEISAIPSADGGMILDKLKRLGTIMSTLERMAIVGDAGWMDLYARLVDPITKPDIRHFTTEERDEAVAWVRA